MKKNAATVAQTPLPMAQIACILCVQICEGLNVNVLFPFVAFMVEDMGYTGNELGYHAGMLAAAFCFAQFLTAVPWGMVSDRFGRKPTIIVGTIGSGLGMLLFGLSRTFPQAVAARMFSGLLSGNLGVVKSLLTEITDDTNRGAAFAYMSLAWAIGCVIAPLAGGMLCKPVEKYPSVFPDRHGQIFAEFPFLLPCILCTTWTLFSATISLCFMKETRGAKKKQISASARSPSPSAKGVEMVKLGSGFGSNGSLSTRSGGYSTLPQDTDMDDQTVHSARTIALYDGATNPLAEELNFGLPSPAGTGGAGGSSNKYSVMQAQLQQALRSSPLPMDGGSPGDTDVSDLTSAMNSPYSPLHSGAAPVSTLESKDSFVITNDDDEEEEEESKEQRDIEAGRVGQKRGSSPRHLRTTQPGSPSAQAHGKDGKDGSAAEEPEGDLEAAAEKEEDEELCFTCCFPVEGGGASTTMDSSSHNLKTGDEDSGKGEQGAKKVSTSSVLRQRVVLLATGNYGMLCAAAILVEETIPLFLKAAVRDGGFGFDSMQIGFLLSISGGVMLLFTSFALPRISRHSKAWMFRVGTIGSIPVALSMPLVALINRTMWSKLNETTHTWLLWTILPILNVSKSVFSCFAFSAVMIQVNHSVHDEYLGAVNGLGQSLAALARAVGPAVGGLLWSISTKHHFVFLNFIVCSCVFLLCLYLNGLLPPSLDFKKKSKTARLGEEGEEVGNGAAPQVFH